MAGSSEHVLVTGGAGFIGGSLVGSLLDRGIQVTVADLQPVSDRRARLVRGDLRRPDVLGRAFSEPIRAVIHLAAETSVLASVSRPVEVHATNVTLTLSLLEQCRLQHIDRFVLASTNAVVGDVGQALIDEGSPLRPLTPYGATKAAAEMLLSAYSASYGIHGSAVRLTNVYGPGMRRKDSFVARLMRACLGEGSVHIYGDGNQVRDYVYIDDAVQGILLALDAGLVGPLTVGAGASVSAKDLHHLARSVTGVDLAVAHDDPRPGEMPAVRVSIARARRLGFAPRTSLREGLEATWSDFVTSGRAARAEDGDADGVAQGQG